MNGMYPTRNVLTIRIQVFARIRLLTFSPIVMTGTIGVAADQFGASATNPSIRSYGESVFANADNRKRSGTRCNLIAYYFSKRLK